MPFCGEAGQSGANEKKRDSREKKETRAVPVRQSRGFSRGTERSLTYLQAVHGGAMLHDGDIQRVGVGL